MGTAIELIVGGISIDYAKNHMGIDHGFLFQEKDRTRCQSVEINYEYFEANPQEDLSMMEAAFVRPLHKVLPRLDITGYTIDAARAEYEEVINEAKEIEVSITRFEENWHHRLMAYELVRCLRGENRRLIVTLPPRNLKSTMASVAFPAFALGHDPTLNIVCVSYSADLAGKFSRDCRTIMQSSWYREAFSDPLDTSKLTESEITTWAHGGRLATSVGATLTGRGGNIIVVDDPLNAAEASSDNKRQAVIEWYSNTLLSRLNNKAEDVIIIVAQRLHDDDLVGHLLRSGEDWVHINLPAIAEEAQWFEIENGVIVGRDAGQVLHETLEPKKVLMDIKHVMGSYDFAAQYQQDPVPLTGSMIKWPWFKTYPAPLERQDGDYVTISWDTASKSTELSDYSVGTVWLMRGSDHYLLDLCRERFEYPDLKRKVVELAERHKADAVLIEDKASGTRHQPRASRPKALRRLQRVGIVQWAHQAAAKHSSGSGKRPTVNHHPRASAVACWNTRRPTMSRSRSSAG